MPKPNSNTPDATTDMPPTAQWSADYIDDSFWGADASLPPGAHGRTIRSPLPDASRQRRVMRELERRVRTFQSPAFPLEFRRTLPGAVLLEGYRAFALRGRCLHVDDFGLDPAYRQRVRPYLDFFYERWFQVELEGLENLPFGPAVLVSDRIGRYGLADALMLSHGLSKARPYAEVLRPLLPKAIATSLFVGVQLRRLGVVTSCLQNAQGLLKQGHPVALFTEPDSYSTQAWAMKLAHEASVPVLPVTIKSEPGQVADVLADVLPVPKMIAEFPLPLSLLPAPRRWTISLGEPLDLSAKVGH